MGVLWCERRQALLWVDIDGARLWMHLPAQGTSRSWPLPDRPGCIGLGQAGDRAALLLALFNLAVSTLVYLPFVVISNKAQGVIEQEESEEDIANALKF